MATAEHVSSAAGANSDSSASDLVSSPLESRRAKRARQQSSAVVPYARNRTRSAFVPYARDSSPEVPVFLSNGRPAKELRSTAVPYAGTRMHNVGDPHHVICELAKGIGRFVLSPLSRSLRIVCEDAWGPLPAKAMIGGCNGYALVAYDCPLNGRVVHEICFIMGTRVWRQCPVTPAKFFGSPWTPFSGASFRALLEPDTCYIDEPEPDPVELGLVRMLSKYFGA